MTSPGFTGSPLDRADHIRTDPAAYAVAVADPRARLLQLDGLDPSEVEGQLQWTPLDAADRDGDLVLLGLLDGIPHFAAILPEPPPAAPSMTLWRLLDSLGGPDVAIYGTARSLLLWHGRHRFCANCGTATATFRAGWGRRCPGCGTEHFPRVDPVVIMLAEHGDRVLVGRQPGFPEGRYSALAGFLEPGESIEEAVARELAEEAGVVATAVRYVASQPWPLPGQLMIAAIASVTSAEIVLDTTELQDAIWVDRADVAAVFAGEPAARFIAPPPFAIAHDLLRAWLNEV